MNLLRLLPAILSVLLVAAHLLRRGHLEAAVLVVLFLGLLLVRRPWVPVLAIIGLGAAGVEWLRTLVVLAVQRQSAGAPWLRMGLILGAVAAFTLASTLVFRLPALRQRYQVPARRGRSQRE